MTAQQQINTEVRTNSDLEAPFKYKGDDANADHQRRLQRQFRLSTEQGTEVHVDDVDNYKLADEE
jgi:hypothetical protein